MYKKVYIMTLPRSGATLFGQQLGLHSRICHMGESMYWETLNPSESVCSCGLISCPILVALYKKIHSKHLARPLYKSWQIAEKNYWPDRKETADSLAAKKDVINEHALNYWLSRCPSALNKVVNEFKKVIDKEIFVDNTKLFNIGEVVASKPDWAILVLLRDLRGVMYSYKNAGIRKKDFRKAESVLPFAKDFIESVDRIRENKNVFVARYEDLCEDPKSTLAGVVEFLGIDYEAGMVGSITKNTASKGHVLKGNHLLREIGSKGIKEDKSWVNSLTHEELENLYRRKDLIALYKEFGYFK